MRFALAACLVLLVAFAHADDAAFCKGQCGRHFTADRDQKACNAGCARRGRVSDGARGFIDCHNACAVAYNATSEKEENAERNACDWACSLPMTNVFMMKVDYGTGDEEPKVQVVHKEGGDFFNSDEAESGSVDLEKLINAARSEVFADPKEKGEKEDEEKETKEIAWPASPSGGLSSMFKLRTGDEEFDKMQERMDELIRSLFARTNAALHRPGGHDGASFGNLVGNGDADGRQILFVSPVNAEDGGWMDVQQERPRESSIRHRFPALFQWTVCVVLLMAVACTLLVALLMARHLRLHRYSALRSAAGRAPVPGPTPLPENPGEMLKKVPIDMEESSLPEPAGVPPPAYDQLSVHKHTRS